MAKAESRIAEKQREYEGELGVEPLVVWLNAPHVPDSEKRRVSRVIALGMELSEHNPPEGASNEIVAEHHKAERVALQTALNNALRYYRMVPTMTVMRPPPGHMVYVNWKPAPGSRLARNIRKPDELPRGLPRGARMNEFQAIKFVLEVLERGLISKIGRCKCDSYYFRKFNHQRFCSEKCRIAEFRTSDEARRKRNEYARKLYHLHKTGKVK